MGITHCPFFLLPVALILQRERRREAPWLMVTNDEGLEIKWSEWRVCVSITFYSHLSVFYFSPFHNHTLILLLENSIIYFLCGGGGDGEVEYQLATINLWLYVIYIRVWYELHFSFVNASINGFKFRFTYTASSNKHMIIYEVTTTMRWLSASLFLYLRQKSSQGSKAISLFFSASLRKSQIKPGRPGKEMIPHIM